MTLPSITVADADRISTLVNKVDLTMAAALDEIRSLLSERDLVGAWDENKGWFQDTFEPLADNFHTLQRAHLELSGVREGREHQLTEILEHQRAKS